MIKDLSKIRSSGYINSTDNSLKLRLKKDIVIPRGTIMEPDGCTKIKYYQPERDVVYELPFGNNASGTLRISTEVGDKQFDEWFEAA